MLTYGLTLLLTPRQAEEDSLDLARQVVTKWWDSKRQSLPSERRTAFTPREATYEFEGNRLWEFTLEQPSENPKGTWRTEVRVLPATSKPGAQCTVTMAIVPQALSLAPVHYFVDTPAFVRSLEHVFKLDLAGDTPSSTATTLTSTGDVDQLVALLMHQKRSLPAVVVTPLATGGDPILNDLASHLAGYLFPMAHVFALSRDATFALTEQLGKLHSCFDGGVRIYWPGFSLAYHAKRHKLYLKYDLFSSSQYSPDDPYKLLRIDLMRRIARASAASFSYPRQMINIFHEAQAAELAHTISSLDIESARERIAKLEKDRDHFRSKSEELEKKIQLLETEIEELEAPDEDAAANGWDIGTVDEALRRAKDDFSATLVFCDPFPSETSMGGAYWYHVFRSLHEVCQLERQGALGGSRGTRIQDTVRRNVATSGHYEVGDTGVRVTDPETKKALDIRERLHLKSGKPSDTESIYWETTGKGATRRYLVARIGRHA